MAGPVFSYTLRYIVGFGLVEMVISKSTIYRNLYENTGPDSQQETLTQYDVMLDLTGPTLQCRWVKPSCSQHGLQEHYLSPLTLGIF